MKTKLVNLKNCPKRIDNGVYIGRGSKWGNPFVIGKDGDRNTVIAKYKRALWQNKQLLNEVPELEGKTLLCWCAPEPCHGHVLIAAMAWLEDQQDGEFEQREAAQQRLAAEFTETADDREIENQLAF
jgi:Domain of unknown function (DUF4326)